MYTVDSIRAARFFQGAGSPEIVRKGTSLGSVLLGRMCGEGKSSNCKVFAKVDEDASQRELMRMALRTADEEEVSPIGKGIHRPYRVRFKSGIDHGNITTRMAVVKTVHCQFENKRYCESVDLKVTGPERELLSHDLDREFEFRLVPPTVGRDIHGIGYGSVQAWVAKPTAWEWIAKGYDYRKDKKNPWLHRLAAFDFIRGEIDRHSNNWIMDEEHRVYAIDNGYSLVKGDIRKWFRSSAGKHLKGTPIHLTVMDEIQAIDENRVAKLMRNRGFYHEEMEGVLHRIEELKGLREWKKLGDLW